VRVQFTGERRSSFPDRFVVLAVADCFQHSFTSPRNGMIFPNVCGISHLFLSIYVFEWRYHDSYPSPYAACHVRPICPLPVFVVAPVFVVLCSYFVSCFAAAVRMRARACVPAAAALHPTPYFFPDLNILSLSLSDADLML